MVWPVALLSKQFRVRIGRHVKCAGSSSTVSVAKSSHLPSKNTPVCQPPCSGQNSSSVRSGSSVGAVLIGRR